MSLGDIQPTYIFRQSYNTALVWRFENQRGVYLEVGGQKFFGGQTHGVALIYWSPPDAGPALWTRIPYTEWMAISNGDVFQGLLEAQRTAEPFWDPLSQIRPKW